MNRFSGQMQLNLIGIGFLIMCGFLAWNLAHPLTWGSALPLIVIAYVFFRITYELTINRKNVPTLATSMSGRKKIAEALKKEAGQRSSYKIIDLGSGRGELTRTIANAIPNAEVMGIEFARIPFWQSVWMQKIFGPKNLSYQRCDFFSYDCAQIDAVVFYLSPPFAKRVGEKLYPELKGGSMAISHTFPLLAPWELAEKIEFRTPFKEVIYVYRKIEG